MSSVAQGLAHSRRSINVSITSVTVIYSSPSSVSALGGPGAGGDPASLPSIITGRGQDPLSLPGVPLAPPQPGLPCPETPLCNHPPLGGFPQAHAPGPDSTLPRPYTQHVIPPWSMKLIRMSHWTRVLEGRDWGLISAYLSASLPPSLAAVGNHRRLG